MVSGIFLNHKVNIKTSVRTPREWYQGELSLEQRYNRCVRKIMEYTTLLEKYPTFFCENLADINEARLHEVTEHS